MKSNKLLVVLSFWNTFREGSEWYRTP